MTWKTGSLGQQPAKAEIGWARVPFQWLFSLQEPFFLSNLQWESLRVKFSWNAQEMSFLDFFFFLFWRGSPVCISFPRHSYSCDASLQSCWDLKSFPIRWPRWEPLPDGGCHPQPPWRYLKHFSARPGSHAPLRVIITLTHRPKDSSL